jgi:hypothetical protein
MNGYNLTRKWYNFKFENPDITKSIHSDLYFYIIDLWNRLGHKDKIGLPTNTTMQCLNIGSYNTYKKTLDDLIEFGFIILICDSKNQHKSKVIALSKNDEATDEALDKAIDKASDEASDTIIKLLNNNIYKLIIENHKEINEKLESWLSNGIDSNYRTIKHLKISNDEVDKLKLLYPIEQINSVLDDIENYPKNKNYTSLYLTASKWLKKNKTNVTSEHEWFLPWFNDARSKLNLSNNYTMSDKIKNNLHILKDKTQADFVKAYKNMVNDDWMKKEGYKYLDPEYTTRKDVFERFLNSGVAKKSILPNDWYSRELTTEQQSLLSPEQLKRWKENKVRLGVEGGYLKPIER